MIKDSDTFDFTTVEGKSGVMAGFAAKYSLRPVQSYMQTTSSLHYPIWRDNIFCNKRKNDQPATWLSRAKGILLSKFEEVLLLHLSQKHGEISTMRVTMHFGVDSDVFNLFISHVVAGRTRLRHLINSNKM